MALLLLFVSLVFAGVFSIFSFQPNSLESVLWFPESSFFSLLFLCLGGIWFSYFFFIAGKNTQKESTWIDLEKAKQAFVSFIQWNLYYIGFIFLYTALYFIIGPLVGYDFWYFIFILSFLILVLFFVSEKFSLFRDLIKINTILFSLYYIISYVVIFVTGNNFFSLLDLLNQIFILAFFILNIYNDKTLLKNKVNDNTLIAYASVYLLLFLVFYISKIWIGVWFSMSLIAAFLSIILKNFITQVKFFSGNEFILKVLSIIFWYIALLCAIMYFMYYWFSIIVFLIGVYFIIDNIVIHNNYQNYSSLFCALTWIIFFYFYLYFNFLQAYEIDGYIFLLYGYMLYFWAIILWYIQKFYYDYDYYFIYSFFYLASTISMLYFLFSFRFELFDFWVMLLLQSIITFMVYYQFNRLKKNDQQNHLS